MMGAGFTAGAVSVFLTMPFDVVKTRMQVTLPPPPLPSPQLFLRTFVSSMLFLLLCLCLARLRPKREHVCGAVPQGINASIYKSTFNCVQVIFVKEGVIRSLSNVF